jgi:nucleoside-triphosphatase
MRKILLTGRPRCGKSTLIQTSLAAFPYPLGGFTLQRLTWKGETWAFRLLDLSEEQYITHLETKKDFPDIAIIMTAPRQGQGIAQVFDTKGRTSLERCWGSRVLVVMDELGKLERDAQKFQACVIQTLEGKLPVLGVLKDKSSPFLDGIRRHPAVTVVQYPQERVPALLADFLGEVRHFAGLE